jgi:hypothetical protein
MSLNVCPADTVHASVDRVWDLLMHPAGYGRFWDLTVEHVEPAGPAVAGQTFVGWSRALGKRWRIDGEIQEVDADRHQILFIMAYPFGVVSTNRLMCAPTGEQRCMVRFG